jgi:hypothetical protein
MKRRAASQWLALLFVILVGVLLRYPRFPNEFAGDTLELHYFTDAIRQVGYVGFVMSPLSWFGVYPVSYPLGVPVLAAILGSLSGMPSDDALALAGIMTGVLGTLGCFCLGHRLTGSFSAALVCAAVFATSGYHVSQSIAGVSGRAMVMSLFPLALLAISLSTAGRTSQRVLPRLTTMAVFVVINIAMAGSHRLFLLAALTEVITLVALFGHRMAVLYTPSIIKRNVPAAVAVLAVAGSILAFGAYELNVGPRAGPTFLTPFLITSDRQLFIAGILLETGYNMGPLVPLLAFGLYETVADRFRWSALLQVMLVAFALEFFIAVPSFTVVVTTPFLALVAGVGWDRLRRIGRTGGPVAKLGSRAVIGGLVALMLALPGYFVLETQRPYRNVDGTSFFTDQQSVESGVFLHHDAPSGVFITPDLTDARRVMADGHIATVSSETTLFIANPTFRDKITIEYRFQAIQLNDPQFFADVVEIFLQSKNLYTAHDWIKPNGGYGLGGHWGDAVTLQPSAGRILEEYGAEHVLLNNNRAAHAIAPLARANYYVEYANDLESVFVLQVTNGCIHGVRGCP